MGKIPPGAKRVFQGVIYDVYQWEQKLFDGSTATFEMLKRPDTVQVIVVRGNKILITSEQQPHHNREPGLYGGRVEAGEKPLAAAKRELLEESGLESNDWELWKSYQPVTRMEWTVYFYIAREPRLVASQKLDPGEKLEMREVSSEEFVELFSASPYWGEFANDLLRLKLEGRLGELHNFFFPA